jgi:hypothetical protein
MITRLMVVALFGHLEVNDGTRWQSSGDSRRPGSWIHVSGFDESDSPPLVIAMAYAGVRMKHGLRAPEKDSVKPAPSVPMCARRTTKRQLNEPTAGGCATCRIVLAPYESAGYQSAGAFRRDDANIDASSGVRLLSHSLTWTSQDPWIQPRTDLKVWPPRLTR